MTIRQELKAVLRETIELEVKFGAFAESNFASKRTIGSVKRVRATTAEIIAKLKTLPEDGAK